MQSLCAKALAILSAALMVGCAAVTDTAPKFDLARVTDETLAERFAEERAHLGKRKPTLGLALSGGGTKAAMFAHGVLHGLNDTGLLDQVDIVSSVSGGGYAAFWYYSKLLEAQSLGFSRNEIFQDCFPAWWEDVKAEAKLKQVFAAGRQQAIAAGKAVCNDPNHLDGAAGDPFRWQAHIQRWPDVFRQRITPLTGNAQDAPVRDEAGLLMSALFELTLGWTGMESNLVQAYQAGIERAWGLNPLPRKAMPPGTPEAEQWRYSNATPTEPSGTPPRVVQKHMAWEQLRALYQNGTAAPPLWIINTNAGDKGNSPNLGHLFELTPFGHGSPYTGYKRSLPPLDSVATGVRAAAAFADSQGLDDEGFRSALNLIASVLPAARWGVKMGVEVDGKSETLRLSDGGGVDNLGLVSLVRRGLDDIIVVDSAQDKQGLMQDLCWAKQALRQEGLEMRWPSLEKFDALCSHQAKPAQENGQALAYNVSAWLNPVVSGEVLWPETGRVTRLWLIKAAWNQQAIRQAYNDVMCGPTPARIPCELLLFYGHNTTAQINKGYMVFPQHGTVSSTLNGSAYLTLGYRELGRMLASHLHREPNSPIKVLGNPQLLQPAYPIEKGRPGPGLFDMPTTSITPSSQ